MPVTYRNVHGRKGGRGIRPYLLFPKYLFVSVFVGGLAAFLFLVFLQPPPQTLDEWHGFTGMLRRAYVGLIVPALLGAMLLGLLLLAMHFRALIRMRWLQVKLLIVAVGVPGLHTYMRGKALALQAAIARDPADFDGAIRLWHDLKWGTGVSLVFALIVIFLGRIKPRLGQAYGRVPGETQSTPAGPSTGQAPGRGTGYRED